MPTLNELRKLFKFICLASMAKVKIILNANKVINNMTNKPVCSSKIDEKTFLFGMGVGNGKGGTMAGVNKAISVTTNA